jgi:hypothetical protein
MDEHRNYNRVDIRSALLPAAAGTRRRNPIGTIVHHTDGIDSTSVLTGHHASGEESVSADVLIGRDGIRKYITRWDQYAYGVGATISNAIQWGMYDNPNERWDSIEVEYMPLQGPTWQQYDSTAECIVERAAHWAWRWPFRIYGHYGIAVPMGRKSDPFLWDWGSFMGFLLTRAQEAGVTGL